MHGLREKEWTDLSLACLSFTVLAASPPNGALPQIKVSENKHFLVFEDGRPFFYLGDTGWELFHRLNREDAVRYLQSRAGQGFT